MRRQDNLSAGNRDKRVLQHPADVVAITRPVDRPWWESPFLWFVLALATVLPFLVAEVPPLTDLPNHVARYYVFLHIDESPFLREHYAVDWKLIGNLGVDLLVRVLGPVLGVEPATRVVVGAIPPLTVAGIYSLSRALNGKVALGALVAVPLAYNWPLYTGFVNFGLSAALALLVLALWIRLRDRGFVARLLIFAPLSFAIWVAHTAGWGLLGLGVLGFELVRAVRLHGPNLRSVLGAGGATFPFALMILFTALWRDGTTSGLGAHFASDFFSSKLVSLGSIFREEFLFWDLSSTLLFVPLLVATYLAGGRRVIASAGGIAVLYSLAFVLCPHTLFGSSFADRRLLTYAAIFMALSVGVAEEVLVSGRRRRVVSFVASGALVFFVARIAVTTAVWARADRRLGGHLELLEKIPRHSRVFALMVEPCDKAWSRVGRPDHLQQLALVRRESVVNGLFQGSGWNQVEAIHQKRNGFAPNMGATVHDETCPVAYAVESLQTAIARFPRGHYDFVWLVAPDPLPVFDESGLILVGSSGNDRLYRVAGS